MRWLALLAALCACDRSIVIDRVDAQVIDVTLPTTRGEQCEQLSDGTCAVIVECGPMQHDDCVETLMRQCCEAANDCDRAIMPPGAQDWQRCIDGLSDLTCDDVESTPKLPPECSIA